VSGFYDHPEKFTVYEPVYAYAWDDETGTCPPRRTRDVAISVLRNTDAERAIVHYVQPHFPFLTKLELGGKYSTERAHKTAGLADLDEDDLDKKINVWQETKKGNRDPAEGMLGYRENLELVLDDIELLLDNVDAENAVISSDHGNATGEWGQWGHSDNLPLKGIKQVPWIETTATDTGEHDPEWEPQRETAIADNTKEKLEQLGYID